MHTGDGGVLDEEGYLYMVDRMKDMIVSGGENAYSVEVENELSQHPAVAVSAVIGVPCEKISKAVHAVVVLRPEAGEGGDALSAALIAHCKQQISAYKAPRSVECAGRVLVADFRNPFWEGKGRAVN